jgi:hypothetical protein
MVRNFGDGTIFKAGVRAFLIAWERINLRMVKWVGAETKLDAEGET